MAQKDLRCMINATAASCNPGNDFFVRTIATWGRERQPGVGIGNAIHRGDVLQNTGHSLLVYDSQIHVLITLRGEAVIISFVFCQTLKSRKESKTSSLERLFESLGEERKLPTLSAFKDM